MSAIQILERLGADMSFTVDKITSSKLNEVNDLLKAAHTYHAILTNSFTEENPAHA